MTSPSVVLVTLVTAASSLLAGGSPASGQTRAPAPAPTLAAADPEAISIRPFAMLSAERFSASTTFDAIFGSSVGALMGGGVSVTRGNLFFDFSVSRFKRDGERAFASDDGGFGVDIPLTVTIRPIEITGGYRFGPITPRIVPYVGGGLGLYSYKETSPDAESGDDFEARHAGFIMFGGAELRLYRWIALAADLHYATVPGILGQGGLSEVVEEKDLGGVAARFRIIFGKR